MRKIVFYSLLSMLIAAPAFASGGKKSGDKKKPANHFQANWAEPEKEEGEDEGQKTGQSAGKAVDLPIVILPISKHGRLVNYLFLVVRIHLANNQDPWLFRAKSHFLSDAIIHKSHNFEGELIAKDHTVDQEMLQNLVQESIDPWLSAQNIASIEFPKMDLQH